ncbi:hypothetical protein GIB67_030845 [Kingdonia uniflora]|uniref:Uncharacterized protein n=1 Tax=Kingdonia uniflora TaxID=39325 RepID=A0A7J7L377_9MAGN|nr:hypothetical protein GIB67_030845 [Kingdonia uniflora]
MKSDKEVNKQFDEENQTQEGGVKKGTSNAKNYTSWCTRLGLHKMFAALPEEEKGVLRTTYFVPLLLIKPIATMSTLVVEIFDRHLGDMKFQFRGMIIQMKLIHVCLILGLRVSYIANEFLFIDPEHMMNFRIRRCSSIKFAKNYTILSLPDKGEIRWGERNQIEAPAIDAAPVIEPPAVGAPAIGRSSSSTEIGAIVVKIEEKKNGKGERQKKTNVNKKNKKEEESYVPLKKKVQGTKIEALTDEQLDHVPLIQLKTLIPKITKKGLANKVPRKRRAEFPELENIQSTVENLLHQVALGEGLEVVKDLMVDDEVEVERKVNLEVISSEYGGDLLELKKGDEKDNEDEKDDDDEKDVEEKTMVVVEVYTMVVAEVEKTDIVFFNLEEVVGEDYQASVDQTTAVSIEEQTTEIAKIEVVISHQEEDVDETSQTKESKEEV